MIEDQEKNMKFKTFLYLMIIVSLVSLSACSRSKVSTPTEAATQPVISPTATLEVLDVRIASLPFIFMTPWFIAQEEGYFLEQGLNVEFVPIESGAQAVSLAMQGEIDVAPGAITAGLFNGIARGGGGRMVAGSTQWSSKGCTYSGILAAKDGITKEQLSDPAVLRGIDMQVKPADMTGFYVDWLFGKAGITFDDINAFDLPTATLGEALQSGNLDLVQISEPWITVLTQAGQGVLLIGAEEVLPDAQLSSIVYSARIITENPEIGRRVMVAYLKGLSKYEEGKTPRNIEIVVKTTQLDQEVVKAMCWPTLSAGGKPDLESVISYEEWALAQGLLDRVLKAEAFYTPEFTDYAAQFIQGVEK
jgi:NitT/TauT family transport system substrate-binding protein